MKTTIIGSGVYDRAISNVLIKNNCDVTMWTELEDTTKVLVPDVIKVTNNIKDALEESELIYILISSKYCKNIFNEIKPFIKENQLLILGSKGILEDGILPHELLERMLPISKYAVISGPTFAVDIASLEPIGFTVATKNKEDFKLISRSLSGHCFLEYSEHVRAVSMAGSLKNAYAIGSGIISGFNFGPSTRCLYITKVLNEIGNIFNTFDSKDALLSLSVVGDLTLTCTSPNSRNFTFGTILSLKNTQEEKLEYLRDNTVEGYENLKVYYQLFSDQKISTPILDCVYKIVSLNENPNNLIELLLNE